MPTAVHRRAFLQQSVLVAGGFAVGGSLLAGGAAVQAIEPIERTGQPKFKFSLAAYSYRGLLSGPSAQLTLADFVEDCARFQLDGTELTSYYFPESDTERMARDLKAQAFRLGLDISGTAIRNDFCYPPGEQRDKEIAHVKRWIDLAALMDAPVIRIFSGNRRGEQTVEEAHKLAVQSIEECCDYAGRQGVYLALENHGGLTATADGLLALVRDVKSPWFGVNFDSGNFHSEDPYAELERIAPYALNAQIKVTIKSADRKSPAVASDYRRLARMLGDAGYRGYIVLEYEEDGDPREEVPRVLAELREVFAG